MLSPQHLALASSLPHSRTSTQSPSLLTPPVSGTPNMSPPPRHEADDYMNAHRPDPQHYKRKHPRRKTRRFHSNRERSEESRPPQLSLRSGPRTGSSIGSDCELCATRNSDGEDDAGSNAPLIRSLGPPSRQNRVHKSQKSTEYDEAHVQTSSTRISSGTAIDESDSPAVNALRSLSFQVPVRSDSQGLRRVSTAFANTLNLFKPNPSVSFAAVPSHQASKKAEEAFRRSSAHSKSLAYQDINRRRSTLIDGKDVSRALETPATITLRKASNVYATSPIKTSMGASLTREYEGKRAADAPASELLAFYSSSTLENGPPLTDIPSLENAEAPTSLGGRPTITSEAESQCFRRRSKSVSQFNDISNARRCSTHAEAALTFADVHVAPGSFAIRPKSRTQSLIPAEFSRRISTVHFRSHTSIHEVIWREDETTSDSSLAASSRASQHAGHSFRSTPSPESEGSPSPKPALKQKETRTLLAMVPESVSNFTKMPDNLFRWTWGASSASVEGTPSPVDPKSDTLGQVAQATARPTDTRSDPLGQLLVISTSDPGLGSLQQSSDRQESRSQRPSFSKLLSVQSFPALRPRSSTAEWRKAPLVDLNVPLAGQVAQYQGQKITHSAGLGTHAESSITGVKERRSSQLHNTGLSRRWSSNPQASVGSMIGASSHKRVVLRRNLSVKFSC